MNETKYSDIYSNAVKDCKFEFMDMYLDFFYRWMIKQGYTSSGLSEITPDLIPPPLDTSQSKFFEAIKTFVNSSVEVAENELLGLEFGGFCGSRLCGFIGNMILFSPNLISIIEAFNKFFPILYPIYKIESRINDKYCYLTFHVNENFGSSSDFFDLIFVGYILTVLSMAMDREDFVEEICLAFSKPRNWGGREAFRNYRFVFDSGCNYIKFPVKSLYLNTLYGDPTSTNFMENTLEPYQIDRKYSADLILKIKKIINGCSDHVLTQEDVARRLCVSTRTLRRKLNMLDTTYQEIINNVRKEKAIYLLKNSNLRLYQISDALGFKNLTNFRRAFKQWTGNNFKFYR